MSDGEYVTVKRADLQIDLSRHGRVQKEWAEARERLRADLAAQCAPDGPELTRNQL